MNYPLFSHEYFMNIALGEAKRAIEKDEIPIGAIVVSNNRIIARAHNYTETLNDVTAHAEMQVITAASNYIGGKYLINCSLYVTVEPCVMCAGAIAWARLGKLIYGTGDEKKGFSLVKKNILHPKTEVIKDILAEECKRIMETFFRGKRN